MPSHSGAAAKRQKVDAKKVYEYPSQPLYVKLLNGDLITLSVPYDNTTAEELANIVDEKMIKRGDYGGNKLVNTFVHGGTLCLPRGEKHKHTLLSHLGFHKECTVHAIVK